jgi:hypothetical protein
MDVEKIKMANNKKRRKKGKREKIFVAAFSCLQKCLPKTLQKY